jgi:hypothetical protein
MAERIHARETIELDTSHASFATTRLSPERELRGPLDFAADRVRSCR